MKQKRKSRLREDNGELDIYIIFKLYKMKYEMFLQNKL